MCSLFRDEFVRFSEIDALLEKLSKELQGDQILIKELSEMMIRSKENREAIENMKKVSFTVAQSAEN